MPTPLVFPDDDDLAAIAEAIKAEFPDGDVVPEGTACSIVEDFNENFLILRADVTMRGEPRSAAFATRTEWLANAIQVACLMPMLIRTITANLRLQYDREAGS